MRPFALVVFDLDGTLVDCRPDMLAAMNQVRSQVGLRPLALQEFTPLIGAGALELARASLSDATQGQFEELFAVYLKTYRERCTQKTTLYTGVREFFAAGHACLYALLTNKRRETTERILDHFGLTGEFACIVADGDLPVRKPDPVALQTILTRLNKGPTDTLVVGDHHTDVEVAQRLGATSAFIQEGIGSLADREADYSFPTFLAFSRWFST